MPLGIARNSGPRNPVTLACDPVSGAAVAQAPRRPQIFGMSQIHRRSLIAAALAAPALIAGGAARAQTADIAAQAAALDQLHSVIISQRGTELLAQAFRGPGLDRAANIKSVSKTVVALLTGIAIDRGVIAGTDAAVFPLLDRAPAGDARDRLTVGHLLTMQTGLESTSGANYGAWINSRNWVDYVLTRDLAGRPGGRFIYSTGGWHVLGAVLAQASGQSLLSLARDWLGRPLGIDFAPWVRDPQGLYLGGNEMAVSPRGLIRLAEAVRKGGAGVIPSGWISQSVQGRTRSPFSGDMYGYGFFITEFGGKPAWYGRGYGGQMMVVVPDAGLSIAITSDPASPARGDGHFGDLRRFLDQAVGALA